MCCESIGSTEEDGVKGVCPECAQTTYDGDSVSICAYSPVMCDLCGDAPCDGSC